MAAGWVAAIAAIAGVAMSGYEYASMPGPPKSPDLAAATREGQEAEASTLADRRRMEAAAQQGTSVMRYGYRAVNYTPQMRQTISQQIATLDRHAHELDLKGQYDDAGQVRSRMSVLQHEYDAIPAQGGLVYLNQRGKVVPQSEAIADFAGHGTADVQGTIAKEQAQNVLDLQAKYGPQFIDEALKQQALADPEGTAARKQSYALIQKLEAEHPDRPVAELLDSQISDQLHAGKNLDSISDSVLKDAVAKAQASRGQTSGAGDDFSAPLTTGLEGEQRQMAAQQKAANWLASGQTPEDVEYRRRQAIEGDLGAFINGRTPESQFQTLSGARNGPAPFYQGQPLPGASSGTGPAANNAALGVWGQQLNFNEQQANPWISGLSMMLRGINAYTNGSSVPRTAA